MDLQGWAYFSFFPGIPLIPKTLMGLDIYEYRRCLSVPALQLIPLFLVAVAPFGGVVVTLPHSPNPTPLLSLGM